MAAGKAREVGLRQCRFQQDQRGNAERFGRRRCGRRRFSRFLDRRVNRRQQQRACVREIVQPNQLRKRGRVGRPILQQHLQGGDHVQHGVFGVAAPNDGNAGAW